MPVKPVVLQPNFRELAAAADLRAVLATKMKGFVDAKSIDESPFEGYPQLEISDVLPSGAVVIQHAGLRVVMVPKVGIDATGNAIGWVEVNHEYEDNSKLKTDLLGTFAMDARGVTNFTDERGRPYYVKPSADLIIAHFLELALKSTARRFDA